ncbi:MAG: iron transporter [Pseudomonadota bacterium]
MNKYCLPAASILWALSCGLAQAVELIIGEARIEPGVVVIFEGAVRDHVIPQAQHLAEDDTDVHIEARVNWDSENIPAGTPAGGFVPYLHIHARVSNANTGKSLLVTLTPHLNLIDNFHYARNITLPGAKDDPYTVEFFVNPPDSFVLAKHRDWQSGYGEKVFEPQTFLYENVDFLSIVDAPPRAQ